MCISLTSTENQNILLFSLCFPLYALTTGSVNTEIYFLRKVFIEDRAEKQVIKTSRVTCVIHHFHVSAQPNVFVTVCGLCILLFNMQNKCFWTVYVSMVFLISGLVLNLNNILHNVLIYTFPRFTAIAILFTVNV